MKARAHSQVAGFTILEVVLAMGVLVLGMTVLLGLLTFGAALSQTAAIRTSSASAIEAVMADLEETLFPLEADGSIGEPTNIERRELKGLPGVLYSARAEQNPDEALEYHVVVEVTWQASGVQRAQRFETILLRQISFGERMRRRFIEGRL